MFPPPWDQLARIYVIMGDYASARAAIARAIAVSPENPFPLRQRAFLALLEGDAKAALEEYRKQPSERVRLFGTALAQAALGSRREAKAALDELEGRYGHNGAYSIAQVHARLGNIDEAFRWLDRAYDQHDNGLLGLQIDPLIEPLRTDPRYQALRARMRYPG